MKSVIAVIITFFMMGLIPHASAAPQEIYTFSSKDQQNQFEQLTQQLRCLVCQNESLADSNAPLAQDLRGEIYQQIQQGKDIRAIKNYLLARYGQFILFKPALNRLTYVLWIVPFGLLAIVFCIMATLVYGRKKPLLTLSEQEKQRLKDLGL